MTTKRPGFRYKGKTFYYDDPSARPRKWISLGSDEATAIAEYERLRNRAKAPDGTVAAMVREYISGLKFKPGTMVQYKAWAKHIEDVFGEALPADVTHADIATYLDNCERTSARSEIAVLSGAYWKWIRAGRITFNPCVGVRCDRPRARRTRLLTDAELDAIIAAADERTAVAIQLAFALGLRPVDLAKLRWSEVEDHVRTVKTGTRIAYEVDEVLAPILARAKALQSGVASVFVLCQPNGQPWKPSTLGDKWRRAVTAAGVKDAQLRDVRAAAGTAVDAAGEDATAFLGHTDGRTTKIYLRGRTVKTVKPAHRRTASR